MHIGNYRWQILHKTGKQNTIWVNFKGGKISYFKAAIILKFSMGAAICVSRFIILETTQISLVVSFHTRQEQGIVTYHI